MEAARYFVKLPLTPPLQVLSEWLPISLTPDPAAQLCTLHIYTDSRLYSTTKPVPAGACNNQIQGNVLQLLREAFSGRKDKFDFTFAAEEMDATLEVRMVVGSARTSFLRLIVVELDRVYMDDPLSVFFTSIEKMSLFMTVTFY